MEILKGEFKKNDLRYKMIKRSRVAAIFQINGLEQYEVVRIYIAPEGELFGKMVYEREIITNNEQFGKDGSKSCGSLAKANRVFDTLNELYDGKL